MSETVSRSQTRKLYDSEASEERQRQAFQSGEIPVAVYGLGRIGLPLSIVYASTTGAVAGVAIDGDRARQLDDGRCPFSYEPRLDSLLRTAVNSGALSVTANADQVADAASVHVIVVPTGVRSDDAPDFSELRPLLRSIAPKLDPGDLVLVESAVPPGTCVDIVRPFLLAGSDLDPDEFGVAACPTRASPGRALKDLRGVYPKIVGGVDPESTRAAELVYDELMVSDVVTVPDSTVAECAKVVESVYRDVNVALANELARLADEIDTDIAAAIEAANTQPHCNVLDPGPGAGGYALPTHPYYLINEFATRTPLLETARSVNESMPEFTAHKLVQELDEVGTHVEDSVVLLLGLAYRNSVADAHNSPAVTLAETLTRFGATVVGVDPLLDDFSAFDDVYLADRDHVREMDLDAVVVVTDHDEFETLDWDAFSEPLVVLDSRDAFDPDADGGLHDHHVYTIGRGVTRDGSAGSDDTPAVSR